MNWRAIREALRVLPLCDHTVDCSDGSHFPRWVWLANTGILPDVVNDGVAGVELEVADGNKCVVVHSVRGRLQAVRAHPERQNVRQPDAPEIRSLEDAGESQTLLSFALCPTLRRSSACSCRL